MHTFKNFKSFEYAEIDLSKPMTLLIGRNGSGKSNVIEGVELLAELLKGREVHEISDVERGGDFEIRGGLQGCFRQGYKEFQIGFKDTVFVEDQEKKLEYKIDFDLSPLSISSKTAFIEDKNLINLLLNFATYSSNKDITSSKSKYTKKSYINNIKTLSENKKIEHSGFNRDNELSSDESVLYLKIAADLDLPVSFATKLGIAFASALGHVKEQKKENQKEIIKESEKFKIRGEEKYKLYKYIKYPSERYSIANSFDIYPRVMRQYSPIGLKRLTKNGSNISSILYYLKQNAPHVLERVLERIKQLPEEEFVSFEFITTSDNSDVLFALKYPNGEIISAKLLSDGTLRALAILTALETVPEGSRIIIEEIDNGVHASRVHILIEAIWDASVRRNLNTLITTHNPATLDSLNDAQLECVVVCHYDKPSQSAKLIPFFELPRVYELMERGHLGSLVVKNIIEQHLEPDFETKRREEAVAWLESLND